MFLSLLSGVFYGISNSLISLMTAKHGVLAISNYWFGTLLCFMMYYVVNMIFKIEPEGGLYLYMTEVESQVESTALTPNGPTF